jgi:16S rRNA (uracil1498-N3)-methyltransferase
VTRFYVDMPLQANTQITLPETVFHHWVRVLRAQQGEEATLFNGLGGEYTARLIEINKKNATVELTQFFDMNRTTPYQVTLGQVMSKGDRMDYAIQKSVELGVHAIQLLISERCEMRLKYDRDQKKLDHWQQVAIAACEQCGLNIIPSILAPLTIEQWYAQIANDPIADNRRLKLVLAPSLEPYRFKAPFPEQVYLLIGPEGGLSEAEINRAKQQHFQAWTLGERILRTETAPVVALSALMTAHEMTN